MSQVSALSLQERLRQERDEAIELWQKLPVGSEESVLLREFAALMGESAAELDRLTAELEAVRQAKEPAGFGDAR